MNRLTTDNPQNNTENMLNLAYVKDRWVHIRGLQKPFMAYIREQCVSHGCNLSDGSDDELCETIFECGFSESHCPVFLLFTIATQAAELRTRLKEHEDAAQP